MTADKVRFDSAAAFFARASRSFGRSTVVRMHQDIQPHHIDVNLMSTGEGDGIVRVVDAEME